MAELMRKRFMGTAKALYLDIAYVDNLVKSTLFHCSHQIYIIFY